MNSLLDDYESDGSGESVEQDGVTVSAVGLNVLCGKGDWPCFLYIDCSAVSRILHAPALFHAYRQCASAAWHVDVHDTLDVDAADAKDDVGLHVSLSRSFALRYSQIDDVHKQVRRVCATVPAFDMHFDGAQAYVNDDASKTFLGALVSVGLSHVLHLIATVDGVMTALGKPTYYQVCRARTCTPDGGSARACFIYSACTLFRVAYSTPCAAT